VSDGDSVEPNEKDGGISVVVIDDHELVAETLKATLAAQDHITVLGSAADGTTGIALVASLSPTVALVDYRLPDMSGADVVRAIASGSPQTKCVVLTGSGQDRALLEALEAGALGFVTKHQRFTEVVTAVRRAARGETTVPVDMLSKVLPQLRNPDNATRLTDREADVLRLVALGKSNAEIGVELFISTNTVRNHVANVLTKLGAKTRTEAAAIAVRDGLISGPD
jgi:DNA-binding NarL/FixJ family response regulator